jgi:hypothetical protein
MIRVVFSALYFVCQCVLGKFSWKGKQRLDEKREGEKGWRDKLLSLYLQ